MFEIIAQVIAFLFDLTKSYGMAIILLTVLMRLLLLPLTLKQTRSMQGMSKLQPEMKKLQEQYGDDREKLNQEVMKLYKEHKVSPAGCGLPVLLQAPILIGLYRVVNGLTRNVELSGLMIRVAKPNYLANDTELYRSLVRSGGAMRSFGIDLAQSAQGVSGSAATRLPYILMVVLIAVTGYFQQVITNKQQGPPTTAQAAQMQKTMKFLPIFFAFISFNIQSAVVLYWIVGNLWMIVQGQILRKLNPVEPAVVDSAAITMPTSPVPTASSGKQLATSEKSTGKSSTASAKSQQNKAGGSSASRGAKPITKPGSKTSSLPQVTGNKQSAIAAAKQAAREGRTRGNQPK
jgi:YidC/Oxa1 family membrane protein insertase